MANKKPRKRKLPIDEIIYYRTQAASAEQRVKDILVDKTSALRDKDLIVKQSQKNASLANEQVLLLVKPMAEIAISLGESVKLILDYQNAEREKLEKQAEKATENKEKVEELKAESKLKISAIPFWQFIKSKFGKKAVK